MAAQELFSKGNALFVEENYSDALVQFSKAIEADGSKDEYYTNRAQTHIKLENYLDAVSDATRAIEISPSNSTAYLRKGIAHMKLSEYDLAKEAFTAGQKLCESNRAFSDWIAKCDAQLKCQTVDNSSGNANSDKAAEVKVSASDPPSSQPTPEQVPMPSGPKTRYDWYQTETHVIITVMVKNVKKEQLTLDIQEKSLSVSVKLPQGSEYSLELDLAHQIKPSESLHKIMSTKIEIKLKKEEGIRWERLEDDHQSSKPKQFNPEKTSSEITHKYPSSSHYTRDWDKVVADIKQEEKSEKPEGDAALNQLFQQIYSDGSDEVRRAMNKSFVESGGTVLSTNWKDIGKKKTEIKPPDGMEFKKYEY